MALFLHYRLLYQFLLCRIGVETETVLLQVELRVLVLAVESEVALEAEAAEQSASE